MVVAKVFEIPATYEKGNVDQDGLWKMIIGELFEDFLLFFAPDLYAKVDFTKKAEFLQQELFQQIIKDKKGRKIADQLVKVHLKDGEEKWVLVHIEVQRDNEPDFAKRMFQYFYRIFDKYDKEIIALAIMTSPHNSKYPTEFHYTYFGTKLNYAYNIYKAVDHSYEELERSDKLFSKIVLAIKYMHDTREDADKRYAFKMKLMREVLKINRDYNEVLEIILYFIDYLLRLPEELSEKLTTTITPIVREVSGMGQTEREFASPTMTAVFAILREEMKEEMKKEGKEETQKKIALEMLKEDTQIDFIAKVTGLDIEDVKKLTEIQ